MQSVKKITFQRVTIQNFLSIGEEPVVINFDEGLHLLTGSNIDKPDRANAVGKSAAIESVYFAIFGATLREIKKDLISNNITGGKTHVELDFALNTNNATTQYKIIRTLNPNKMYVYENEIDKTRDSIANTTKYVCDILCASPAVFQNCVIMSVNNAIPFMAKNKIEKRKFIEDIFGLEVFSEMVSQTRQQYNEIKRAQDIEIAGLQEIDKNLSNCQSQKAKILEERENKRKLYTERKASNRKELLRLEKKLKSATPVDTLAIEEQIVSFQKALEECDEKITAVQDDSSVKRTTILHKKETYKKIGTKDETCPVCLRHIDEHNLKHIDHEKTILKGELESLVKEVELLSERTKKLKGLKDKIKTNIQSKNQSLSDARLLNQELSSTQERIDQLKAWQEELEDDISTVTNTTTEFDGVIADMVRRKKEKEREITQINKQLTQLDIVKFIISEEGVKSYIVNKLLDLLNSRMAYYLKKLDANFSCSFNEYFEEEIANDKNKICSYFNFSGAERKTIDLACLFAFSDMRRLQGGVSYNIAIYDELFDSSFDERGIEIVTEILRERVTSLNECSIIVSHRKESLRNIDGDVIFLEKRDGITRRVSLQE
jgi:DNA repair exonuclease SbcCD ATPase subunit